MSKTATLQTTSRAASSPSSGLLLQRACACGGAAGLAGECEECKTKKLLGKPLQTKLAVSQPGDEFEQEADRVAEQVMRMPDAELNRQHRDIGTPLVQRRATNGGTGLMEAPPIVHNVLNSPGQPLAAATRAFFEPRFGYDFSQVRVHTDERSVHSAREVDAHAYTVGHGIVFSAGKFAPATQEGMRLLAHELTHVVQQSTEVSVSGSRGNGRLSMGGVIHRKASFVKGTVSEQLNLADQYLHGRDAGKTDFVLNGSTFTTVSEGRKALQTPQIGRSEGGKHVRCWFDSLPENNVSYSMKALSLDPWSVRTTKGKMYELFPTLKACEKNPKAQAVFTLKGDPTDEDQRKRTREHEGRHATDYETIFTEVIEPWDKKITESKTNKQVVAGVDRNSCEQILYKSQVGEKKTPDGLIRTIINRINSMGKAFHDTPEGRMVIVSDPKVDDKSCNSVTAKAY